MFDNLLEKKAFVLNCDVCDARKIKEEDMAGYEQIIINTDVLIVNEQSRSVLNRLPAVCNADTTLDLEGDFHPISYNGDYEITGTTPVYSNTVLTVNGTLKIHPGTEEVLKSFVAISVNGCVQCPQSMTPCLKGLHVNGSMECYPDDCTVLDPVFTPDAWFALRARENGKYFVSEQVQLTEPRLDAAALAAKKVRFCTPSLLVLEEKVADAAALVDETAKLEVIPAGYSFADGDFTLDDAFLSRYGTRVYVSGSLTLTPDSEALLPRLEGLIVLDSVSLPAGLRDAFLKIGAQCGEIIEQVEPKGKSIRNKVIFTLDDAVLDASSDGISASNCAVVRIHKDVPAQRILDLVSFSNCAKIFCTPEQKGAVELVSQNVAFIGNDGDGGGDGLLDMVKQLARTKIINADQYVL